jgi:glycosyltransferase involved in cell wall biosynthesis
MSKDKGLRVLYSFPHKIGADRICYIAWNQVWGLENAGAMILVFPGAVAKALPEEVRVMPTLALGKLRIPYKLLGSMRAFSLHDHIVASKVKNMKGKIDIIHLWPLGSLKTLKVAARLGIPTVLERPNAHTRFAYEVVQREIERIGVTLPKDHEHAYKADVIRKEEEEYRLASALLCPSEFVLKTFTERGFPRDKLVRHMYGYDENRFHPEERNRNIDQGLTVLFAGVCAVRKGLHYALEAWLKSVANHNGRFLIAGEFLPSYFKKLSPMLKHSSISVLGHRRDIPDLMRKSDIMVLPSIEEGFGLVCAEAIGSGCVPLVSEACTEFCRHMENSLVHRVGDVEELTKHFKLLYENPNLLNDLRSGCIKMAHQLTWKAAGFRLLEAYKAVIKKM